MSDDKSIHLERARKSDKLIRTERATFQDKPRLFERATGVDKHIDTERINPRRRNYGNNRQSSKFSSGLESLAQV